MSDKSRSYGIARTARTRRRLLPVVELFPLPVEVKAGPGLSRACAAEGSRSPGEAVTVPLRDQGRLAAVGEARPACGMGWRQ
ncbi:hypothetical protein [Streptomyces sp. CBMA123]|uniref:hypothetical protein n=1 Tax=Streptomyces sp. CBMA123 TaxID=1896313 RepID=UPI0016621B4C|nr:hypothetical protein [Streptomyces sp. CBMA123]